MIRVHRPADIPQTLLNEGVAKTAEICGAYDAGFRNFEFDSSIYGHAEVKAKLVEIHHGKCCYCESKIRHIAPGDVDHYRPKKASQQAPGDPLIRPGYYWLAYDWNNLLLICPTCNQSHKRNLFPLANPAERARSHKDDLEREKLLLINPTEENPGDFVGFHDEILFALDGNARGRETIKVLGLNDRKDLVERRTERLRIFKHLQQISKKLLPGSQEAAEAEELFQEFLKPEAEYSAMVQAALHTKP